MNGILFTAADAFFNVCAKINTLLSIFSEIISWVLYANFVFFKTLFVNIFELISHIYVALNYIVQGFLLFMSYLLDFLAEIFACLSALVVLVWRLVILFYKIACFILTGIETLAIGLWDGSVVTLHTLQQSASDVVDTSRSTLEFIATLMYSCLTSLISVFTSVGKFSSAFVRGFWIGLGYFPAAVLYIPRLIGQLLIDVWERFANGMSSLTGGITHQTYVGVIVIFMMYILLHKLMRILESRGMTLYTFRQRRPQHTRQQNIMAMLDRDFESDLEDVDDDFDPNENNDADDDSESAAEDSGHSEYTLTDHDSVSDDDDDDDGSESDVSLNSQTFSTEESDHEIDVQLPSDTQRQSLRSRSSTPSCISKNMTPSDFEREIERERDKRKCVVCQDASKSVLILPCRHMCLCVPCADKIVRSVFADRRICPLCRGRIEKIMAIYA